MLRAVRYGPNALLLRFAESVGEETFRLGRALIDELQEHPPAGLVECVPGFTTLLLRFQRDQSENLPWLARYVTDQLADVSPGRYRDAAPKEITVQYDGDDLESLAEEKGLTVADVIQLHSEPVYKVYLLGFSPGFPYLGDLHPKLHTPRRATPRAHVPAGAVAIGGEHTGIYSVASPGGWRIIGHTRIQLFDRERLLEGAEPADVFHLRPGDRVRFVPDTGGAR
jgi:KipI family sensor histidine kinase inhibitor